MSRVPFGNRITTFIKAFGAAWAKAGCPGRIPHDLRRTAVRNLVRAGQLIASLDKKVIINPAAIATDVRIQHAPGMA